MKSHLYIKELSGKGRAVFSEKDLQAGILIEACPLLIIPSNDSPLLTETTLCDYFFHFDKEKNELALALGFGSLYNHAVHPNAFYEINPEKRLLLIYAVNDIPAGTEICFNYSGTPGNAYEEWFTARGMAYIT